MERNEGAEMDNKTQAKLSAGSRNMMLEYLTLGFLNTAKDSGTNLSLKVNRVPNRSLALKRDPLAEILINALKCPSAETEKGIVQIMPAEGWTAVFASEPEQFTGDRLPLPKYYAKRLICWALKRQFDAAKQKHKNVIVGIVDHKQETFECNLLSNFLGYRGLGQDKEDGALREAWFNWYNSGTA